MESVNASTVKEIERIVKENLATAHLLRTTGSQR